jgi:hypothetical protein
MHTGSTRPGYLHNQLQQAKRQLQNVKRQKRRLFTQCERQYWDTVGQQAETAEERGDTYVLYSFISKLKIRKANNIKQHKKLHETNNTQSFRRGRVMERPF